MLGKKCALRRKRLEKWAISKWVKFGKTASILPALYTIHKNGHRPELPLNEEYYPEVNKSTTIVTLLEALFRTFRKNLQGNKYNIHICKV
jgi:hypothetical protein